MCKSEVGSGRVRQLTMRTGSVKNSLTGLVRETFRIVKTLARSSSASHAKRPSPVSLRSLAALRLSRTDSRVSCCTRQMITVQAADAAKIVQ